MMFRFYSIYNKLTVNLIKSILNNAVMNMLHHSTNQRDAMLQSMFKNAPIGILVLNREGVILGANPSAQSLLDYKNKELAGKCLKSLIPNQFQNSSYREGYLNDPSIRQMFEENELFVTGKNGKEIPVVIELSKTTTAGDDIGIAFIRQVPKNKGRVK